MSKPSISLGDVIPRHISTRLKWKLKNNIDVTDDSTMAHACKLNEIENMEREKILTLPIFRGHKYHIHVVTSMIRAYLDETYNIT